MIVKEALNQLSVFPPSSRVEVSDYTDKRDCPCCVRKETDKIVVDFVSPAIAALNQTDLSSLTVSELRHHLQSMNSPESEVVFSNYAGEMFNASCARLDVDTACFDIDGVV